MSDAPRLGLRRALLAAAAAALLLAVLAGLARIGLPVPGVGRWVPAHGSLLVVGAFTTVISLERAVALGTGSAYLAPALGAAAAGLLALGRASEGAGLGVASALALVGTNVALVRRQDAPFTRLMLLASVLLVASDGLHAAGFAVSRVVLGWMAFFVLTITAERLEMSRLAPVPQAALSAVPWLSALLAASSFLAVWEPLAAHVAGGVFAAIGVWLLRFDLATRTVRGVGLSRFSALAVLSGAAWLVIGGLIGAIGGLPPAGPAYDAVLHAVLVGFVLSMVFAHAPIIFPAVARVSVPFSRGLYLPLCTLHLSLGVRVGGDLLELPEGRLAGGAGNAVALLLFVVVAATASRPPVSVRRPPAPTEA